MDNTKNIMITGATSQIGMATIREFIGMFPECYFILITRSQAKLAERIKGHPDLTAQMKYRIIEVDLCKKEEVEQMIEPAVSQLGHIDILVNIAGDFIAKPFIETKEEDFYQLVMANLFTMFTSCKSIVPFMLNQRFGSIVNISSVLGVTSIPQTKCAVYGAVKAAIIQFTKLLAMECGEYNVRVNCICPGVLNPIDEGTEDSCEAYSKLNKLNHHLEFQALRWFGSARNIAKAIAFIGSEQSEWTTGSILQVDGGMGI